jgi:D-alanine-D-alanine ligase
VSKIRVAVVMGGRSSEHEISLASARSVIAALDPARYDVATVEIGRDGRWALGTGAKTALPGDTVSRSTALPSDTVSRSEVLPVPRSGGEVATALSEVDVVVPILHGPFGEDGTVQGLLALADVPFVGPDHAASALCMDKDLCKSVLRQKGIECARHHTLYPWNQVENPFGYPVFVKPARLGSSVGITKVHDEGELAPAVALARRHDEKVLIEEFVAGAEVECGVLGNFDSPPIASVVGEIVPHNEWYDYAAKYDEGGSDIIVPARIDNDTARRVQEIAVDAFLATGCEGMARIDFFVRDDGTVVVNEINTIPGFTSTSVYARLFEASGIGYGELLDRLVRLALDRHERRAELQY